MVRWFRRGIERQLSTLDYLKQAAYLLHFYPRCDASARIIAPRDLGELKVHAQRSIANNDPARALEPRAPTVNQSIDLAASD